MCIYVYDTRNDSERVTYSGINKRARGPLSGQEEIGGDDSRANKNTILGKKNVKQRHLNACNESGGRGEGPPSGGKSSGGSRGRDPARQPEVTGHDVIA